MQKGCIIKYFGFALLNMPYHTQGGCTRLLNGRVPLPNNAFAPSIDIFYFNHIPSRINIRCISLHPAIHQNASPTSDTTGLNKVYNRRNTDGDQYEFTGYTYPFRGHYLAHPSVFPY